MNPELRKFYDRAERDAKYYGAHAKKLNLSDAQLALLDVLINVLHKLPLWEKQP